MSQDIFIPLSKSEDAVAGPLNTVTWITNNPKGIENILIKGYSHSTEGWHRPNSFELNLFNHCLGFSKDISWKIANFMMTGDGENITIRVIAVDQSIPCIRPSYDGLFEGGATISCPILDLSAHEEDLKNIGIHSTIGIKNMEFQSPSGEKYISSEIVYKGPDNIFVLGVTRPNIFIPIGPIDEKLGIGGIAYSARCTTKTDETIAFFKDILGYEIRRDVAFEIDDNSAINIPEGATERFIQGFSPGTSSGYIVLMDHGEFTKYKSIPLSMLPGRGIVMWSFPVGNLDEIYKQSKSHDMEIVSDIFSLHSDVLGYRNMVLKDPDGFLIELFEK